MRPVEREDGYTLIEVMTALVLMFIVLLPATYAISYLLTDDSGRNQIAAANLAEEAMERALLENELSDQLVETQVNGQTYRIENRISQQGDLLRIDVGVYHRQEEKPLLAIYRYVIAR